MALAFWADALWGRDITSFASIYASSFSTLSITFLIESTFINFVFGSTATFLRFFGPLRSLSCDYKLYIWASLYATSVVSCLNCRATFCKAALVFQLGVRSMRRPCIISYISRSFLRVAINRFWVAWSLKYLLEPSFWLAKTQGLYADSRGRY